MQIKNKQITHIITQEDKNSNPIFKAIYKRVRNLNKKLTDIQGLEKKDYDSLKPSQQQKIKKKDQILKEIKKNEQFAQFYKDLLSEIQQQNFIHTEELIKISTLIVMGQYIQKYNNANDKETSKVNTDFCQKILSPSNELNISDNISEAVTTFTNFLKDDKSYSVCQDYVSYLDEEKLEKVEKKQSKVVQQKQQQKFIAKQQSPKNKEQPKQEQKPKQQKKSTVIIEKIQKPKKQEKPQISGIPIIPTEKKQTQGQRKQQKQSKQTNEKITSKKNWNDDYSDDSEEQEVQVKPTIKKYVEKQLNKKEQTSGGNQLKPNNKESEPSKPQNNDNEKNLHNQNKNNVANRGNRSYNPNNNYNSNYNNRNNNNQGSKPYSNNNNNQKRPYNQKYQKNEEGNNQKNKRHNKDSDTSLEPTPEKIKDKKPKYIAKN